MSQISSQSLDPDWVSLSIVKFSHNTSPYGIKTYTWNHISTRTDLNFVIRNVRHIDHEGRASSRVVLQITAGAEVLETQDLFELLRFCQQFDPTGGAEHPVDVVCRSPFIAMKYPKNINTVRRFQVKFHTHDDYQKICNVLKDIGLSITSKEKSTPMSIQATPSPVPSLTMSLTSCTTLDRPSSAVHTVTGGSPLKSEFRIPGRPTSTLSDLRGREDPPFYVGQVSAVCDDTAAEVYARPSQLGSLTSRPLSDLQSHEPQLGTLIATPNWHTSWSTKPAPVARMLSSEWDNTAQPPPHRLPQAHNESQSRHFSMPASQLVQNPHTPLYPKTSLYIDQLQRNGREGCEVQCTNTSSSYFRPSETGSRPSENVTELYSPFRKDTTDRPASTSALPNFNLYTSSEMKFPPKQILPFPNPKDLAKSRASSASDIQKTSIPKPILPRSSTSDLRGTWSHRPILPPSTSSSVSSLVAAPSAPLSNLTAKVAPQKRVAQRKAAVHKVVNKAKKQADDVSIVESNSLVDKPLEPTEKSAIITSSSPQLEMITRIIPPPRKRTTTPTSQPTSSVKRPKMSDQFTQTDQTPEQDYGPSWTREGEIVVLPPRSPSLDYADTIDAFVTKHMSRPAPRNFNDHPDWATASADYRERFLNDFICENLENEDFRKLCEDMEMAWRRIGL